MKNPVKLYDLSQPIYHNCPGWPEYAPTQISRDYCTAINGFNAETITLNTHTGTHIDVPYHFFDEGQTIEKIPIETFAGSAVFVDMRTKDADTPITAEDLKPHVNQIEAGDIAILNTGWGKRRGSSKEYHFQWPYLGGDGAKILLDAGVKVALCNGLSMGGWGSPAKGRPCHEILLGAGVFLIEELCIPDALMDGRRYWFSAFPILLNGCGGSLVRAVAYEF